MKGIIIFLAIMFLTGCSNGMNFSDYTKGLNNAAENVEDGVKGDMKRFGNDMMNMADGKTQKTTNLGEFSTPIVDSDADRLGNIDLAISRLNGYRITSGETFSFNEVVGARTFEAGYRDAIIFLEDDKQMGLGGGICQVSTTLYNAAINSGLEITERHAHKVKVPYIEQGKDATISDTLDLKIKNNKDYDIRITVTRDDKHVKASFDKIS